MQYSLFWDDTSRRYLLIAPNGNTAGRLDDNPEFAQKVMRAFNDQVRLRKLESRIAEFDGCVHAFKGALHGNT